MQTWAKRGVQAALVTGGMLAAGTGVASASEECSDPSTSPPGGSKLTPLEALGDGTPRTSGPCFSGELFPDGGSVPGGRHAKTTITGTIDPVRDLLPAVEDALTQQIPRIRDDAPGPEGADDDVTPEPVADNSATERLWIPPEEAEQVADRMRILELAGWVADTTTPGGVVTGPAETLSPISGHPNAAVGLLSRENSRGRHAAQPRFGTPADGYHRSLSWSGPIGDVADAATVTSTTDELPARGEVLPPELVRPAIDPAVVEGFDQAETLTSLWESVRGRALGERAVVEPAREPSGELLSTRGVDLTSGLLGGGPRLHTVPDELLGSVMSAHARPVQAVQQEFVPLQIPGENQERVDEVPNLSGLGREDIAHAGSRTGSARPAGGRGAGVVLPVPGLGEMHALGGGDVTVPDINRIADALDGNRHPLAPAEARERPSGSGPVEAGRALSFAAAPEDLDVTVAVLDELAAAVPERDVVTRNPFREAPSARTGVMALPVLGGGVPDITAVQDQTLPLPRVDVNGTPVPRALDTAAMLRGVSGRF